MEMEAPIFKDCENREMGCRWRRSRHHPRMMRLRDAESLDHEVRGPQGSHYARVHCCLNDHNILKKIKASPQILTMIMSKRIDVVIIEHNDKDTNATDNTSYESNKILAGDARCIIYLSVPNTLSGRFEHLTTRRTDTDTYAYQKTHSVS